MHYRFVCLAVLMLAMSANALVGLTDLADTMADAMATMSLAACITACEIQRDGRARKDFHLGYGDAAVVSCDEQCAPETVDTVDCDGSVAMQCSACSCVYISTDCASNPWCTQNAVTCLSYTACPRVLDAVNVALDALGVTAGTSDYRDGYERAGYGERVYSDPYGEFAIDGASEASKSIFSNIYVIIGIAAGSCVLVSVICASIFCCRSDRDRQLVEVNPWGDADNDRIVISGGKSKKKKKGSAASPIIDDQPRLSTGIRGPPEAGILFAVESIKEKHAGQTVKKDLRSTTQTSSTLRKGYWATIRHATTEGDHIVEVRTATKAESFLSQIPCPCCGGSDDASAPNAGPGIHSSISVDGFTTWVFPTSAIKWVQTGEASLAASLQTQNGLFFCCSACFSGSGGDDDDDDDDDESNCCDCCEYEFNDVTKSMKSKSMTIHTTLGTSIPLNWDDQNTALASEKLDCCNPSIQRKSTEVTNYDDDGTVITTVQTSEHREPPTFPCIGACCYRNKKQKAYTTVHKCVMDDAYKGKCETKGEDLTSLAKMLMNLRGEDT